ncbi:MAG: agmatine deiminase family protein, partial [Candidatus Cloacimonetes bacterium]|nr:agmatine deiminase family protein [Candidatus Cloacimonadota bacterium]
YHVVPDALGEYIKHIDCWAKYLAPDVIMIIEVSPSHSHYAQIEAAVDYFESQPSCYGTPYQVERVYTHLYEPYINSLILNNKVLVPITGSGWDDDAITAYESAMPGHEVLGFTGSWYNTDALHCRTMGVTDRGMLYIKHTPVEDTVYTANDYFVQANIIPYSGESVIADSTLVYWKTSDDDEFNAIQMQHAGNRYFAFIPAQPDGTTIQYYIHSADSSGRSENHPYIGAPDAHSFYVQSGVSTDTQIASQKNIILYQNYPNPFSTSTTISFFNTKPSKNTKIKIYNIKGQLVNEFKIQSPIYSGIKLKINEIIWDGKDEEGKLQTNGIYFYSLKINNKIIQTKKMLLMR